MTSALTTDTTIWFKYILKDLWKLFAWLYIPGTTITIAEALVSMAAIGVITWCLKKYTNSMRNTQSAREYVHNQRFRDGR